MHRLVHLATRNWLRTNGTFDDRIKLCLIELAYKFPSRIGTGLDTCTLYAPHAEAVLGYRSILLTHDKSDVLLASHFSPYLQIQGRYKDAEVVIRKAIEWLEVLLKEDPMLYLYSIKLLNDLAGLMLNKESYEECDVVIRKLLDVIGLDKPWVENTEWIQQDIQNFIRYVPAISNHRQWRLDIAKEMFADNIRLLDVCKFDPSKINLKVQTLNILGLNYEGLGLLKETEESYQQALEIGMKSFGEENQYTVSVIENLIFIYQSQERYMEAIKLRVQLLNMNRYVHDNRPSNTLHNLSLAAEECMGQSPVRRGGASIPYSIRVTTHDIK